MFMNFQKIPSRSLLLSFLMVLGFSAPLFAQNMTPKQYAAGNAASNAAVSTVGGFPRQIQVDNKQLILNGYGTRYKAIFKVYDMAMYTTNKVTNASDAISMSGPKRLQFVALRDLASADLALLFLRGIRENSSTELNNKLAPSTNRFIEMVSTKPKILTGETFAMDFVPGKGVTFYIADKAQGAPMGDAEFFGMVMRIWLGSVPADFMLKDALLSIPKS